LTQWPDSAQHATVSDTAQTPLQQTLRWLTTHAGFPASRLPDRAELLVLLGAVAAAGEEGTGQNGRTGGPLAGASFNAQLRSYTIQRRHAHVKCDNSAKV
jgi:hypothetical protein